MEPWGEFLDHECYYEPAPIPIDPWTLDPWRQTHADVVLFPRDFIESIVQPEQLRFCLTTDLDRVWELEELIAADGLQEPFVIVLDHSGHVILRDGHHRLVAMRNWSHFDLIPCVIESSEKIRTDGYARMHDVLLDLLRRAEPV